MRWARALAASGPGRTSRTSRAPRVCVGTVTRSS
jgi:hypothetical protein